MDGLMFATEQVNYRAFTEIVKEEGYNPTFEQYIGFLGMNAKDIFIVILDSLTEESRRLDGSAITDHIATMACKAAVKGNNKLSFKEADALIEQLLQAKNPYTCPHGRPTIISLSKYELEKKFKRIQS